MKHSANFRKIFCYSLFLLIFGGVTAMARLGENFEVITQRLGKPSIEMRDKDTYGWLLDRSEDHYLVVVFNNKGKSVAEQVKSFDRDLDSVQILNFFESAIGKKIKEKDFTPDRTVEFAGFKLDFGRTAATYLDNASNILYVWERGANPSASVYNKKGIWVSQNNRDKYKMHSRNNSLLTSKKHRMLTLGKSTVIASQR